MSSNRLLPPDLLSALKGEVSSQSREVWDYISPDVSGLSVGWDFREGCGCSAVHWRHYGTA